ncbi:MAG TPA: histidine kinase [Epulopiscium sp.]|nr:histidine kinase [Candidatus Epulonipiscium sp.]
MKKRSVKSIKTYLISISITFTLIITLLITSFIYAGFSNLLSKSLIQSTSFNLSLMSESISKNLLPVMSLSEWCKSNLKLHQYIETANRVKETANDYDTYQNNDTKQAYTDAKVTLQQQSLEAWKRLLEEYRTNHSSLYINRVVVSNLNGDFLQISPISTYHAFNVYDTISNLSSFDRQVASNKIIWTGLETDPFNDRKGTQILPLIQPVYNLYKNKVIGWSYLALSTNIITDNLLSYDLPHDSTLLITINHNTYQLVGSELIPMNQIPPESRLHMEDMDFTIPVQEVTDEHGVKHKLVTFKSSVDGWYFSQTLSSQQFSDQRSVYYILLISISIIIMLLGLALAFLLNNIINKPLAQLLQKMDLVSSGDFSYDPTIEWENELGEIGRGINSLSQNVSLLMEKRLEDEKEKNQLEYEILQSQINPHFLYNTLNSIKWMASIQNATGIVEMTTSLSKLLRSVSKDVKQIHLLSDEIKLLDHYFLIQRYRYGGALSLTYTIEDDHLLECLIPKFTLQPIVENAIFHGIEPKQSMGEINIHVYIDADSLLNIDIHDNGVGMTEDQIHDILTSTPDHKLDFFKKIGINNVNLRIKHSFGDDYGLSIVSSSETGTTVQIKLSERKQL